MTVDLMLRIILFLAFGGLSVIAILAVWDYEQAAEREREKSEKVRP